MNTEYLNPNTTRPTMLVCKTTIHPRGTTKATYGGLLFIPLARANPHTEAAGSDLSISIGVDPGRPVPPGLLGWSTAWPALSPITWPSEFVVVDNLSISLTKDVPQNAALYLVTYLNSFRWFSARASAGIVTASWIASATCWLSHGLT